MGQALQVKQLKHLSNMISRTVTDQFFICKVAVEEINIEGVAKKVIKSYVVPADSWGDAEDRIAEYLATYGIGLLEIADISRAAFSDVFLNENDSDMFFLVKLLIITVDERTGREKKNPVMQLYQAGSLDEASRMIAEAQQQSMLDYSKAAIKDAKICDILER